MSEEYVVRTKSGSFYPIVIEGGLIKKKEMKIVMPEGEARVTHLSDESNLLRAVEKDPKGVSVDKSNLKPGKIIVFDRAHRAGNTSRIASVYKKVA